MRDVFDDAKVERIIRTLNPERGNERMIQFEYLVKVSGKRERMWGPFRYLD